MTDREQEDAELEDLINLGVEHQKPGILRLVQEIKRVRKYHAPEPLQARYNETEGICYGGD